MNAPELANYLADEIFRIPEYGRMIPPEGVPVRHIQFYAGTWPSEEIDAGAINKRDLAQTLQWILQRYDAIDHAKRHKSVYYDVTQLNYGWIDKHWYCDKCKEIHHEGETCAREDHPPVRSFLDGKTEDWIEEKTEEIMDRYEKAGTPMRGGAPIAEALREAYRRGQVPWTRVKDGLPEVGQYVILLADRYWNTPDGIPNMKVTATGYLNDIHGHRYWSVFGERGFALDAFTHWMPIP